MDRTLDRLIAENVLDLEVEERPFGWGQCSSMAKNHHKVWEPLKAYSRSDLVIFKLVDEMCLDPFVLEYRAANQCWSCMIDSVDNLSIGETRAEAICKALLRSRGYHKDVEKLESNSKTRR